MEQSTIEQPGEKTGQVKDLLCFRANEAGRRPAAQFLCCKLNMYRLKENPHTTIKSQRGICKIL